MKILITGFSADMRPEFVADPLNVYGSPIEDENGKYYNVSTGNGETRRDYFPETPLEAFHLIKSLLEQH